MVWAQACSLVRVSKDNNEQEYVNDILKGSGSMMPPPAFIPSTQAGAAGLHGEFKEG